jgi:hypothetical protein
MYPNHPPVAFYLELLQSCLTGELRPESYVLVQSGKGGLLQTVKRAAIPILQSLLRPLRLELLRQHPELPPFKQLDYWRRHTPWFSDSWRKARQAQADFLVQKCLDLAKASTPKTAHVTRVQFDIYRWLAAKFHPEVYGHKPAASTSTTLNVGIAISPERLQDIRHKLDITRSAFLKPHSANATPEPAVVSRAMGP